MNLINSKYLALLVLILCVGLGCKDILRSVKSSGTLFTIEIHTDEPNKGEIFQRAVGTLQSRLRAISVDGDVTRTNDRISIKIYGSPDLERVKKFLFTTNQLELKKVAGGTFQLFPSREQAQQNANAEQEVLPYEEASRTSASGFIIVEKKAVITGADIRDAQAFSPTGDAENFSISFTLNEDAAQKFGDWTGKNIGSYLAIVLDKKALSAPSIRGQIFGTGSIDGRFSRTSAEDLALSLKSGYLPATMKVVDEQQIEYPFYRKD